MHLPRSQVMPRGKGFLLLACLLAASAWMPAVQAEAVSVKEGKKEEKKGPVLLTLEWPPYTSVKLADNGVISSRIKAAYAAVNQDAKIGFFSWRRAMRLPYTDRRFTGFFPAYPSAERKQVCHFSEPVGMSQLGLAQLNKKPLSWARVEDLSRYRLGIVHAYANEESFDRLAKEGRIKTTGTETDAENLLNLIKGRVDGAVIDAEVFKWLLKNDARLSPWSKHLQMNERLLVTWPLFVCFRKDPEGALLRDQFNAGLSTLHQDLGMAAANTEPVSKPAEKPQKQKRL